MSKGIILMIVDEDRDDRFFFKNALREIDEEYKCVEAFNGLDALEKLRSAEILPDYIFLDLNMPLMSGKECLIALKSDPVLSHIPVIIYSTSSYWQDIEITTTLGAAYYLTKVWDINKLPTEIINAMEKAKQTILSKTGDK
jgi:CheY-like chemotaxis protein